MKLLGITHGALLQRVSDGCETVLHTENTETLTSSVGTLTKLEPDVWLLTGIEVGGPYSITFSGEDTSVTYENRRVR